MIKTVPASVNDVEKTMLEEIRRISPLIYNNDWKESRFSLQKAYVCALFSKLAYLHVPQYELAERGRIKVVPCEEYQQITGRRLDVDVRAILSQAEFERSFVIESRYVVIIGARAPHNKFVVVAVRGTADRYDWFDNLDARRHEFHDSACFFHRGFFKAIAACFEELGEKLMALDRNNVPIYVTGHSLGGAMAAILHALWAPNGTSQTGYHGAVIHSAYTFGMPRYGNWRAVIEFPQPYHLYNAEDIVPSVPPTWLGFDSCLREFMLDGARLEARHSRQLLSFLRWTNRLYWFSLSGVAPHLIGTYLGHIRKHIPDDAFIRRQEAFMPRDTSDKAKVPPCPASDLPIDMPEM